MIEYLFFMDFLYFPKDKSEYIPAFIILVIFMIGAVATMYVIYKKSKKDEKKFDEQFKNANFNFDRHYNKEDETRT